MKLRHLPLSLVVLLLFPAQASAGTCTIEITGQPERYKFVHVYDVAARKTVLRKAIKTGHSEIVTVDGTEVRVDWKFPGGTNYHVGFVQPCQDGSRIKT